MMWVGLTGGIASGKSAVSRFLREAGAFIIDADEIAHAVILKGGPAYRSIVDAFGKEILDPSGEIDRKRLGQIVFNDPDKRRRLNHLVHPHVFERAEAEKEAITRRHPKAVIVFDAALLIETGACQNMDWTLVVYVDRSTQIERLTLRDGLTREQAEERIAAQMPLDEKIRFADEVIDNRKPLDQIKKEVFEIFRRLQRRA